MSRQLGYATAAILAALDRGYRYGLEIMDATGLPSGTVYPTLTRMEARAYVAGTWEAQSTADREGRPRRRYYRLTPSGRKALTESARVYHGLVTGGVAPQPDKP